MPRGLLWTVDELRACGALDVPPEWRKSLGNKPSKKKPGRDLFSDVKDEVPKIEEEVEIEEVEEDDDDSEETDPEAATSS